MSYLTFDFFTKGSLQGNQYQLLVPSTALSANAKIDYDFSGMDNNIPNNEVESLRITNVPTGTIFQIAADEEMDTSNDFTSYLVLDGSQAIEIDSFETSIEPNQGLGVQSWYSRDDAFWRPDELDGYVSSIRIVGPPTIAGSENINIGQLMSAIEEAGQTSLYNPNQKPLFLQDMSFDKWNVTRSDVTNNTDDVQASLQTVTEDNASQLGITGFPQKVTTENLTDIDETQEVSFSYSTTNTSTITQTTQNSIAVGLQVTITGNFGAGNFAKLSIGGQLSFNYTHTWSTADTQTIQTNDTGTVETTITVPAGKTYISELEYDVVTINEPFQTNLEFTGGDVTVNYYRRDQDDDEPINSSKGPGQYVQSVKDLFTDLQNYNIDGLQGSVDPTVDGTGNPGFILTGYVQAVQAVNFRTETYEQGTQSGSTGDESQPSNGMLAKASLTSLPQAQSKANSSTAKIGVYQELDGETDNFVGTKYDDKIIGSSKGETIKSLGGEDQVFGGDGNDKIIDVNRKKLDEKTGDTDFISGGNGDDLIRVANPVGNNIIQGDGGNDRIFVASPAAHIFGGEGNDRYKLNSESEGSVIHDIEGANSLWISGYKKLSLERIYGDSLIIHTDSHLDYQSDKDIMWEDFFKIGSNKVLNLGAEALSDLISQGSKLIISEEGRQLIPGGISEPGILQVQWTI